MAAPSHRRLHSHLWSSETLVKGMKSVTSQSTTGMMLKTEDESDSELAMEYAASCLSFHTWVFFH